MGHVFGSLLTWSTCLACCSLGARVWLIAHVVGSLLTWGTCLARCSRGARVWLIAHVGHVFGSLLTCFCRVGEKPSLLIENLICRLFLKICRLFLKSCRLFLKICRLFLKICRLFLKICRLTCGKPPHMPLVQPAPVSYAKQVIFAMLFDARTVVFFCRRFCPEVSCLFFTKKHTSLVSVEKSPFMPNRGLNQRERWRGLKITSFGFVLERNHE